ncbi:MAG: FtsX-like permease family protein [Methanobacteriota archaeon]
MITEAIVLLAAGALGYVAFLARRDPVAFRMGMRNPRRRRLQTLAVVLGLMVGTAVIASALTTGDSTTEGIRAETYRALGEADEIVSIEGGLYFPEWVLSRLREDPDVAGATDGTAGLLVEDVAVNDTSTGQHEPRAQVVAVDPETPENVADFVDTAGDRRTIRELSPGEVFVNERLADEIDATEGDRLRVHYAVRPNPVVPRDFNLTGRLAAGAGVPLGPLPPYASAGVPTAELAFEMEADAAFAVGVLLFEDGGLPTDLDLEIVSPHGARFLNTNGTPLAPDVPVLVNVTHDAVAEGEWRAYVRSKAAIDVPFELHVLVFYEVYDLAELADFSSDLSDLPPPAREAFDRFLGLGGTLPSEEFEVAGVVRDQGMGGLFLTKNVYLPLGEAQRLYRREGEVNMILVSNRGGVVGPEKDSERVSGLVASSLDAMRAAAPDSAAVQSLSVRTVKADLVAQADEAGKLFGRFLYLMGSFTVVAGVLLIVNIFVMLGEERRRELGVARALGMRRRDIVRTFLFEGAIYSVAAVAIGAVAGLLLAAGIVFALNTVWGEAYDFRVPFQPEAGSLLLAAALGLLITLVTIALTADRIARMNVVHAVKDLPDEDAPPHARRLQGTILLAMGLAATAAGFLFDVFAGKIVGVPVAILGAAFLAGGTRFDVHRVWNVAGLALFFYVLWTILVFEEPSGLQGNLMAPLRGLLLVIGAVLATVNSKKTLHAIHRLLLRRPRLRAPALPGAAYPFQKPLRTGLTMTMFALVLLVIVLFSILFAIFTPNVEKERGGYDIEAETTVPVASLEAYARERGDTEAAAALARTAVVDELVLTRVHGGKFITIGEESVDYRGPTIDYVYGFGADFADHSRFHFAELDPAYASGNDALRAMLGDPSLVVVAKDYTFDEEGRPKESVIGETLRMKTVRGEETFRIVGVLDEFYFAGVWLPRPFVESHFQDVKGQFLITVPPGEDPVAVARDLEAGFQEVGLQASPLREEIEEMMAQTRQIVSLFQVYLGLGLVVGIASLAIVTARNVIERRREIGVLRALGFTRRMVLAAFLTEVLLVTTLGILLGTVIGFVVAKAVHMRSIAEAGFPFVVPWTDIAVTILVAYVATVALTMIPAWRASRIPPSEAVRMVE